MPVQATLQVFSVPIYPVMINLERLFHHGPTVT